MKKLLASFFQVLCFLQVFGYSQLNAHPGLESLNTASATHFNDAYHSHLQLLAKAPLKIQSHSLPQEKDQSVLETLDEEDTEYEQVPCKKVFEGNHSFLFFHLQLPEYLQHNSQNSLAFCKQLSFSSVKNRHVIFEIFRI